MNDPFKSNQFFFRIDDVGDVLGEAPEKVDHKHLELVYHQFIIINSDRSSIRHGALLVLYMMHDI